MIVALLLFFSALATGLGLIAWAAKRRIEEPVDIPSFPKLSHKEIKELVKHRYSTDEIQQMGRVDVIIVGGGIGGLSTASFLSRYSHRAAP
jgi:hypothetical protein